MRWVETLLVLVAPVLKVWMESWSLLRAEVGVQDRKAWSEISLARIVLFTCWMFLKKYDIQTPDMTSWF